MPYLEPYLMRSVRAALKDGRRSRSQRAMSRFCSQEGQHYQQHAKVNDILRRRNPAFTGLAQLEAELEADYKRFSADKDHAFNLAYAEAFECMTMAMSCTQMEMRVHEQMTPPIRDLFLWHITEEMEHRTVAFDAYRALGKGYLYRVRVGRWAQRHYLGYVQRFHRCFLAADAQRIAAVETPADDRGAQRIHEALQPAQHAEAACHVHAVVRPGEGAHAGRVRADARALLQPCRQHQLRKPR